jgi:hypothetical protein
LCPILTYTAYLTLSLHYARLIFFQFGVNRDLAAHVPTSWPNVGLLAVAVVVLCVAAVYAARTWRAARFADDELGELPETS